MKKLKSNPRKVTESQIKSAVKAKAERMQQELRRNPNNLRTAQRLAEFKKIHKSKLAES